MLGELDRVAGEIEQHLAQPCGVADHMRGQALIHIAADFKPLAWARGPKQLDRFLDKGSSANGRAAKSSRPASILKKSRISSISVSSVSPEVLTAFR